MKVAPMKKMIAAILAALIALGGGVYFSHDGHDLVKVWDAANKTVIIGTAEGVPLLTIEQVSHKPDICTCEEVLNVTSYVNYELNHLKDFRARWQRFKGKNNITKVDWHILKNESYQVIVDDYGKIEHNQIIPNIIFYENITDTWTESCGCAVGEYNSMEKWNITRETVNGTESGIVCFDRKDVLQNNPLKVKVFWNQTEIIGNHDETRYHDVWKSFSPVGKMVHANKTYTMRLTFHKPPEIGDVSIQTIPMFRGVECAELTWWNTSWGNKREIKINNTGGSALTYYQVNVNLTSTPINSTSLRVVNETADATVPHWQETISSGNCTDLWFNATSIPASAWLNGTYCVYYGNAGAANDWDGDATFIKYDGFEDGDTTDAGDLFVTASNYASSVQAHVGTYSAKFPSASPSLAISQSMGSLSFDSAIIMDWIYISSTSGRIYTCGITDSSGTNQYNTCGPAYKFDGGTIYNYNGAAWVSTGVTYTTGWRKIEIRWKSASKFDLRLDDGSWASDLDTYKDNSINIDKLMESVAVASGNEYTDDYCIRKYAAPEPSVTIGSEESTITIESYAPATPLDKNAGDSQTFNVTASESCQCRWYINDALVQTNSTPATEHAYTNTSLALGANQNFSAVVNASITSNIQTWDVTVTTPPVTNFSQSVYKDSWQYVTNLNSTGRTFSQFYSQLSAYYLVHFNKTTQRTYGYKSGRWTKYANYNIPSGDAAMLRYTANDTLARDNATGTFSGTLKTGLNHIGHSYNGTKTLQEYNASINSNNVSTITFSYPANGTMKIYTYGSSANGTVPVPQGFGVEVNVTADTAFAGI